MKAIWLLAAFVLIAACSRGTAGLGALPRYPGATPVGTTTFEGEASGFPRASWTQVELRSGARFEQVRDFYKKFTVRGWTSTFELETPKSDGRLYTRLLADGRRREFYTITVEERKRSSDVSVMLRRGLAR